MQKKVFIIGNGPKEFALAKKMAETCEVFVTPSSDTLSEIATCVDIREDSVSELLEFVMENGIDLTIPISQKSLCTDIVEIFNQNKLSIFAPNNNACLIITDKAYAKKVLYKLRIQTPKFGIFEKSNLANDYIKNQKIPFVIKSNDSNSATIVTSVQTAKNILDYSVIDKNNKIIIEDYVYGTPFSYYAITDGYKALPIGSSITYKYSLDDNGGQLTSGMGACSPNYKLSTEQEYFIMDNVIYPTLDYLDISGSPYIGILGVNGILTENGDITILGWQSFMQDCDAQAIIENIDDDLYSLMDSCVIGSFSDEVENITLSNLSSVSLVLKCKNKQNSENVIKGLDNLSDAVSVTFGASTKKNKYLEYEANYGTALILTSQAATISKAAEQVYNEVKEIDYLGIAYRKDICKINY